MPLQNLVVDANVFAHADNSDEERIEFCLELIRKLTGAVTILCVDEGFTRDESSNRSVIGYEYIKHVQFGSVGHHLITHLASTGRVLMLPADAGTSINKKINQMLRNKHDRVYLKVAYNTVDRTLTSHDFNDMSARKRKDLRKDIGVSVVTAEDTCALL